MQFADARIHVEYSTPTVVFTVGPGSEASHKSVSPSKPDPSDSSGLPKRRGAGDGVVWFGRGSPGITSHSVLTLYMLDLSGGVASHWGVAAGPLSLHACPASPALRCSWQMPFKSWRPTKPGDYLVRGVAFNKSHAAVARHVLARRGWMSISSFCAPAMPGVSKLALLA